MVSGAGCVFSSDLMNEIKNYTNKMNQMFAVMHVVVTTSMMCAPSGLNVLSTSGSATASVSSS